MNWSVDDLKLGLMTVTIQCVDDEIRQVKHIQLIIHLEDDTVHWIDAQQIGDLAVHEPIADVKGMWRRVTHVPTLTMFDKALPDHPEGLDLLWWIAEVQKGCLAEWAVLRELTPDNYNVVTDRVQKAKDKILTYCQSVRVS